MQGGHWFSHAMPSTPAAIFGARDRFQEWLRAQDVEGEVLQDLVVVVSELGANAVAAAAGSDSRIEMRAWREDVVLVLEVENAPRSRTGGVVFHNETDPLRGHGQGLMIVTAYTDSIEVIPPRDETGLVVRCRKAIAAG